MDSRRSAINLGPILRLRSNTYEALYSPLLRRLDIVTLASYSSICYVSPDKCSRFIGWFIVHYLSLLSLVLGRIELLICQDTTIFSLTVMTPAAQYIRVTFSGPILNYLRIDRKLLRLRESLMM